MDLSVGVMVKRLMESQDPLGMRPPSRLFRGIRDKPQTNRVFLLFYTIIVTTTFRIRTYICI
jgi:hypothetical protein